MRRIARWRGSSGQVLTITQNIDALHEAGGTRPSHSYAWRVQPGAVRRLRGACAASTMWTGDLSTATICRATARQGRMRPDVVWFGEMPRAMERIHEALLACDLFLDAVAPRP